MSEQVLMNKDTGDIGLGIRIQFFDKVHEEPLAKLEGYSVTLRKNEEYDGWLIFSGQYDAEGPWVFIKKEAVDGRVEILGEL